MSDIVIDRERLIILKKRLYEARPLSGGTHQQDQWALVMQDVENMLGTNADAINLCPSCKRNDVCWFDGTNVILCRYYLEAVEKVPEVTVADSFTTQRDLNKAVGELSARITADEKQLLNHRASLIDWMRGEIAIEIGKHEMKNHFVTMQIVTQKDLKMHWDEERNYIDKRLDEYAPASQMDAIGKLLERHLK
jgi:hypothetical protein